MGGLEGSYVPVPIEVPDELPQDASTRQICRCGHPLTEHLVDAGCQAARSRRPESMGGGLGSSRCECELTDAMVICTIPKRYLKFFRQSPIKGHALTRALIAMKKAGALDEIEWEDDGRLHCALGHVTPCTDGALRPLYLDREAKVTRFYCPGHAKGALARGAAYEKLSEYVSVKKRRERMERHVEMLNSEQYRRARGLVGMSEPVSAAEAQRTVRRERETE